MACYNSVITDYAGIVLIGFTETLRAIALNLALMKGDATAATLLQPDDFTCIALTVFGEARGESEHGQAMVVQSMINRHEILGRSGCRIAQRAYDGFRIWKHRDPRQVDRESWRQAQLISLRVIMGEVDLGNCVHATHFLNPKAVRRMPNWASQENRVCAVGAHVGYRVANI